MWKGSLHSQGTFSWGGLCWFFLKSSSITNYFQFYDTDSLLTTLTTLLCKTTHKRHSLVTNLTPLIYMKNSLSLTTLTTLKFKTTWEVVSSLTTLATLILKTIWETVSSLNLLITWFSIYHNYTDYADIHDNMKDNFITEYNDF